MTGLEERPADEFEKEANKRPFEEMAFEERLEKKLLIYPDKDMQELQLCQS